MSVGYGEKDLEVAILGCPAQHYVEPGPAVLQEVGDRPLVSSWSSQTTVGQEGDVSVMLELEDQGWNIPLVQSSPV